jgi:hypothetical protein
VQCDVRQSDAYKNRMDGLAKLVRQQKLDCFWLFCVNDPLNWSLKNNNLVLWLILKVTEHIWDLNWQKLTAETGLLNIQVGLKRHNKV